MIQLIESHQVSDSKVGDLAGNILILRAVP